MKGVLIAAIISIALIGVLVFNFKLIFVILPRFFKNRKKLIS